MKNQEFLVLLDARIEEVARAVFFECEGAREASAQTSDDAPAKLREQLAFIKAGERSCAAFILLGKSYPQAGDAGSEGQNSSARSLC